MTFTGIHWTPERDEILRTQVAAGASMNDCAALLGVSRSSAQRRANEIGLESNRRVQRGWSATDDAMVFALRAKGWAWVDIDIHCGRRKGSSRQRLIDVRKVKDPATLSEETAIALLADMTLPKAMPITKPRPPREASGSRLLPVGPGRRINTLDILDRGGRLGVWAVKCFVCEEPSEHTYERLSLGAAVCPICRPSPRAQLQAASAHP